MADDTTNALRELIEAAQDHLREYASGQRHNDEGRRYKATQRLRAALAALATAQPEAKPEWVRDAASRMVAVFVDRGWCDEFGKPDGDLHATLCEAIRASGLATRQAQGGGEDGA